MNDKSNILASLMGPKPGGGGASGENKENERGDMNNKNSRASNGTNNNNNRLNQPTSGHNHHQHGSHQQSNKQHRLKQRFTVIKKLGKGTYGKVQLAINKETGQEVAIKTIKKTKIENEQDLQRVRREIQIMSSIEHPYIIHIYEVFENKDKIVLVMQYAPGGELYEYVSQSKLLDDTEARRLFRQIATAIYYCHQNKICHRDLKLENILLDEKNNAKLADFGLSNVFDKSHQLKTFCGSPLYASPEIVQGSPYEGPEVDCWSLGVLLYTLVYGAMPFDGSNFKRLVRQISESCYFEPKQKSQASPLIRKLLCADPTKRATVLDICSDPWVNGISSPSSPLLAGGDNEPHQRSPTTTTSGHHQSLLKVAQDMANLTPVRFDILLALTPGSMAAEAAAAAAAAPEAAAAELAKPPLNRPDPSNHKLRRPSADSASGSRRSIVVLDPSTSIMELEDLGRATSPVASYIVRDLLAPEGEEKAMQPEENKQLGDVNLETDVAEVGMDEVIMTQVSDKLMIHGDSECQTAMMLQEVGQQTSKDEVPEQLVLNDNNDVTSSVVKPDDMNDHSTRKDEPIATLVDIQQQQPSAEVDTQLDDDEVDRVETKAIRGEDSLQGDDTNSFGASAKKPADSDEEEVKMNVDSQQVHHQEPPEAEVTSKSANELPGTPLDAVTAAAASDDDDKNKIEESREVGGQAESEFQPEALKVDERRPSEDGVGGEEKPKKVKKKIVVVKKRKKRIANKEPDGVALTKELDENGKSKVDKDKDISTDSKKSQNSEIVDAPKPAGKTPKAAPGKVRIPNTFQPQATPPPVPSEPEETSSRGEGRRQSSLVADVSQKLLLQSTSPTTNSNTVNLIRCDQPQLASVRVSDKKSEFERRASLAAISAAPTAPNGKPTVILSVRPQLPELYQAELLRESLGEGNLEQMTIIEPLAKLEPFEARPIDPPRGLRPPLKQDHECESESQTPTNQKQQQATGLDDLEGDIRQKLIDLSARGSLQDDEQQDEQLPVAAASNDRSDSVETIKAEAAASSPVVLEAPSVRSQFSIQLGGSSNIKQSAATPASRAIPNAAGSETPSSARSMVATGPAPITRSYKKVTFTRDGACITETGKIYSRQADDGTVRRVERKSKITHYPAGDTSQLGAPTSGGPQPIATRAEEVEEEEEELYEEGEGGSIWQGHRHQSSSQFHDQQVDPGQRKPPSLERLIMPTPNIGTDLFAASLDQEFAGFPSSSTATSARHQVRPPSFTGRERSHSRQLGRADSSCSSCSSGSTDIFDDIFDHWTGAISMFNQGQHTMGSRDHFRPFSGRISGSRAASGGGGRRTPGTGGGGSLAGTPRCESAEPQAGGGGSTGNGGHLHNRRRRHREWCSPGANTSGYESDAASERPATAMGGSIARGSLSRLFPSMGAGGGSSTTRRSHLVDPFFADTTSDLFDSHLESADSLRRTIAQEHDSLRRRLAQQHKQLWKGSTPSLLNVIDDEDPFEAALRPPHPPRSRNIGHLLRGGPQHSTSSQHGADEAGWRPMSAGGFQRPPRLPPKSSGSSTSMGHNQKQSTKQHEQQVQSATIDPNQQQTQSWPRETLEQSQSSSSFLRQSIALDSAPTRRSGHQTQEVKGGYLPPRHEFQTMRRSTSKVSLLSDNHEDLGGGAAKQQSIKHQASFIELKRTSSSDSANQQLMRQVTTSQQQQQKGLQHESMAHTTTMATATATTTTAGKVISNRVVSNSGSSTAFWETVATPTTPLSCGTQSGPLEVENRTLARDNLDSRVQSWLQDSTGNMSTSSGSKSSVSATSSEQQQHLIQNQHHHQQQQQQVGSSRSIIDDGVGSQSPMSRSANASRQVTSRATFTLRQSVAPEVDVPNGGHAGGIESHLVKQHEQQQVSSSSTQSSSMTNVRRQATTAISSSTTQKSPMVVTAAGDGACGGPLWTHETSSRSIFGEELDEMSLSGGESPSSSSLLDQLRSRGYRSMINQRMVAQQTAGVSSSTISDQHQSPEQPPTSGHQVSSSSASQINRQDHQASTSSSSSSRVIISTSSTRVVQQKQQQLKQIITSSSIANAAMNDRKRIDEQDEVAEFGVNYSKKHYEVAISDTTREKRSPEVPPMQNETKTSLVVDESCNGIDDMNASRPEGEEVKCGENNQPPSFNGDDDSVAKAEIDAEDEDVREAKASIKAQLDRVKETEMFLKSLHAEEAEAEQKRQQLFMFNNLILNSKLNGAFKSQRPLNDEIQMLDDPMDISSGSNLIANHFTTGPRSAPVAYMAPSFGLMPYEPTGFMTNGIGFSKSYHLQEDNDICFGSPSSGYASRKLQHQPLASLSTTKTNWSPSGIPYTATGNGYCPDLSPQASIMTSYNTSPPVGSFHYSTTNQANYDPISGRSDFRRSKSQLSDQFNGGVPSMSRRGASRPISANLDSLGWMSSGSGIDRAAPTQSVYFPSRARRSFSQIREATSQQRQQSTSNRLLSQPRRPLTASVSVSDNNGTENDHNVTDEDDDHGLSSYRVSAYVPKVVPQGAPARGRSSYRRGKLTSSDWSINGTSHRPSDTFNRRVSTIAGEEDETKRVRRISLQENNNNDGKIDKDVRGLSPVGRNASPARRTSSPSYRRRSLTSNLLADDNNVSATGQAGSGERSRLSELEQRIAENKRRREELLAGGRVSPTRPAKCEDRDSQAAMEPKINVKLNARPSRLESMEARIKRRSFYVRTSPERGQMMRSQQNLDKWRRPSNCG